MSRKITKVIICICALLLIMTFFSFRDVKYTTSRASRLLDKYQSELEKISSYMINESPRGRYLKEASYEDSYLNCGFLPQDVRESMEVYFRNISARNFSSIYVLREDTKWYWNVKELPDNCNLVSFSLYMGTYAQDNETGNDMVEYQMLCYSDMALSELEELLETALLHSYEVCTIKENWYLVTKR